MIILGIDPGWDRCGWAKLEVTPKLLDCGLITTSRLSLKQQRLKELYQKVSSLIKKSPKPDILALEEVHLPPKGLRISNLLGLGEARGVLLLAAAENNLEVCPVHPLQVKSLVTGNARSSKELVARFLSRILGTEIFSKSDDTADAVAIAYAAVVTLKIKIAQQERGSARVSKGLSLLTTERRRNGENLRFSPCKSGRAVENSLVGEGTRRKEGRGQRCWLI